MRRNQKFLLFKFAVTIIALIAILSPSVAAQTWDKITAALAQSTPKTSSPQQATNTPQPADQEQFVSYWTTEPGWNTELQLRNNLESDDLVVTPAVRTAAGAETALPSMTIKSGEVVSLDLDNVLVNAAPQLAGAWGSLVLRYRSIAHRALYAAVMVRGDGRPIAFHLDANERGTDYEVGSREGIWWLSSATVTDYLILTNTGDQTLDTNLIIYDSSGKAWQQKLSLGVRETRRLSIRSLVQQAGFTGSYGGIKLDMAKGARFLDSTHLLFEQSGGFSAIMKMFRHDPGATVVSRSFGGVTEWTTRAPMLALSNPDPALGFPTGTTLQPKVYIRNATGKAFTAHLRFNWRSASTSGKSAALDLPFNPNETKLFDVAAMQAQKLLPADAQWASVILSAAVLPDELLAVAASYDQTGHYGAQTPFSDQLASHWEAGKWEVDTMHNSLVTIANGGNKAAQVQLTVFYNRGFGQYQLEQTLAPDEQMAVNFGKLIHDQVPDKIGRTLPPGLMSGSYRILDLTHSPLGNLYEGKVIVDKTFGHAAYGCCICCGPVAPILRFNPLSVPVGGFGNQGVQAIDSCGGGMTDVTDYFPSWWTDNTSIATANESQISGVAPGTTNHHGQSEPMYWGRLEDAPSCAVYQPIGTAPTNVLNLSCPSSVTRGANASCSISGAPSGTTFSGWKFTDTNNNVVSRSGNNNVSTWSGTMVAGGTVSVMANGTPLSASITVTARNWHTNPASPTEVSNGTFFTLPIPPQNVGIDAGLAESKWSAPYNSPSLSTLNDGGPNQGYTYFPSNFSFTAFYYQYEISPDLENSASTFSQHQSGINGVISWTNLLAQTRRHEYNSLVQSHYAFYSNSMGSNNPGDYLEQQVASPGSNLTTFINSTTEGIGVRFGAITSAFLVEPFPVNYSETGTPLGIVCYAPYTACN